MASPPYFNTVTTKSAFTSRFELEKGTSFGKLPHAAASNWGRQHLLACRVIRRQKLDRILPLLANYHRTSLDTRRGSFPPEIDKFLSGPTTKHEFLSEHQLIREYGVSLGQTWASLATFKDPKDREVDEHSKNEEDGRRKRARRSILQGDYVDSSTMTVSGPESGEDSDSSSQPSPVGYVEDTQTLRLANCVIRHVLYYCSPQEGTDLKNVVEFRDKKLCLKVLTPQGRQLTATDDGGLCLRQNQNGIFRITKPHITMLEAKKRFHLIQNGRPIITDECFAQMTCEALAARIANQTSYPDEKYNLLVSPQLLLKSSQLRFTNECLSQCNHYQCHATLHVLPSFRDKRRLPGQLRIGYTNGLHLRYLHSLVRSPYETRQRGRSVESLGDCGKIDELDLVTYPTF
jgi:hypothetical protein